MSVTRLLEISQDASFGDLYGILLAEWQSMPTLRMETDPRHRRAGHFDDLKYESPRFRVWVSRMHLRDYDGDVAAYTRERFTIEELIAGVWRRLDRYGKVEE